MRVCEWVRWAGDGVRGGKENLQGTNQPPLGGRRAHGQRVQVHTHTQTRMRTCAHAHTPTHASTRPRTPARAHTGCRPACSTPRPWSATGLAPPAPPPSSARPTGCPPRGAPPSAALPTARRPAAAGAQKALRGRGARCPPHAPAPRQGARSRRVCARTLACVYGCRPPRRRSPRTRRGPTPGEPTFFAPRHGHVHHTSHVP